MFMVFYFSFSHRHLVNDMVGILHMLKREDESCKWKLCMRANWFLINIPNNSLLRNRNCCIMSLGEYCDWGEIFLGVCWSLLAWYWTGIFFPISDYINFSFISFEVMVLGISKVIVIMCFWWKKSVIIIKWSLIWSQNLIRKTETAKSASNRKNLKPNIKWPRRVGSLTGNVDTAEKFTAEGDHCYAS